MFMDMAMLVENQVFLVTLFLKIRVDYWYIEIIIDLLYIDNREK
jgi:hypothetical protein